jgi:hypothetical protein
MGYSRDPNWRPVTGALAQIELDDDVVVVGRIVAHDEDGMVTVLEGHAFSIWGGSNGMRGERHYVPASEVRQPHPASSRRIAAETVETYYRDEGKWDRQRKKIKDRQAALPGPS